MSNHESLTATRQAVLFSNRRIVVIACPLNRQNFDDYGEKQATEMRYVRQLTALRRWL
jgi:hypothetical protein